MLIQRRYKRSLTTGQKALLIANLRWKNLRLWSEVIIPIVSQLDFLVGSLCFDQAVLYCLISNRETFFFCPMKHQFFFLISVYLALRPPSRLAGNPILSGIRGGLIMENSVHIS
jgi:hypothetical protein